MPLFRSGIFFGWWVVLAACVVNAVPASLYSSASAIFFLPLAEDLHLSHTATALVFSISRVQGAFSGPIAGYTVDRWGPGKLILIGAIITGLGYLLLSRVNSYSSLLVIYLGVISMGHHIGFMHTVLTAVNSWFIRRRGLAMGLVGMAVGAGGAFTAPLLGTIVHHWGWRTAAIVGGFTVFATALPASRFMRRSPESMGLNPDGSKQTRNNQDLPEIKGANSSLEPNFTASQAFRTSTFWALLLAVTLRLAVNHALTIHFIPMMVWKGTSARRGAFLFGAVGLFNIPLRITLGVLGDTWRKSTVMAIAMAIGTLTLLFLAYSKGESQLWLFVLIYSIPDSTGTLNWAMIGDFYGRRSFATIRGTMHLFYGWGTALAPVIAGIVYDRTDSYLIVLWMLAGLWACSCLVFIYLARSKNTPILRQNIDM